MNGSDSKPLVSVVITTYNCGRYIGQAVDSILAQTYVNYEIIIVDDGSEDDTAKVLACYGDRLRIFRQPNLGLSRARNRAFRHCTGKYIAFLDADDQWKPYKLAFQVAIFEKMPAIGMLFTNFDIMDEDGNVLATSAIQSGFPIFKEYRFSLEGSLSHQAELNALGIEAPAAASGRIVHHGDGFSQLFRGNFVLPSTEMFRRECLSHELQFNERYRCATDQDFHLRLARRFPVAYIECAAAWYRINRMGKLSGKNNTATLIRNTIETRKQIIAEDTQFAREKRGLVREVMGKSYARLAYFHLRELEKGKAVVAAFHSLSYLRGQWRPWLVLALAVVPSPLLNAARRLKQDYRLGAATRIRFLFDFISDTQS
jgi:glycosyltransferase involved in cell wall biosynthesis